MKLFSQASMLADRCIMFVAVKGFALSNSRLPLMKFFIKQGWRVVAATSEDDHINHLKNEGVIVEPISFRRGGFHPFSDFRALIQLIKVYHRYRPALIQHFNGKPIVLGNFAALCLKKVLIVNTVTGLGHAFLEMNFSFRLFAWIYQLFCSRAAATIFQNESDYEVFVKNGWVNSKRAHVIVSSGIDFERFIGDPKKRTETPTILLAARLVWMKGISEFVDAAREIKSRFPAARFFLAGAPDLIHPDSIPMDWVRERTREGVIEYLGYVEHPEKLLQTVWVCVLPSYREGVSRILLEAAACEVPIVATDVPGCRETVQDGKTGILVPPRDRQALVQAITKLLQNPKEAQKMGEQGRRFVRDKFDVHQIMQKYIQIYQLIGLN